MNNYSLAEAEYLYPSDRKYSVEEVENIMSEYEQRIEELENDLDVLQEKYDDLKELYNSMCIRYQNRIYGR